MESEPWKSIFLVCRLWKRGITLYLQADKKEEVVLMMGYLPVEKMRKLAESGNLLGDSHFAGFGKVVNRKFSMYCVACKRPIEGTSDEILRHNLEHQKEGRKV